MAKVIKCMSAVRITYIYQININIDINILSTVPLPFVKRSICTLSMAAQETIQLTVQHVF